MNSKTFNTKIVALALLVATATGIALFPTLQTGAGNTQTTQVVPAQSHRIEVVFVLRHHQQHERPDSGGQGKDLVDRYHHGLGTGKPRHQDGPGRVS